MEEEGWCWGSTNQGPEGPEGCVPTCESISWDLQDLASLWGAGDGVENVVVTGVQVRGPEGGGSQQHGLAFQHLQQHVGGQERGTVVLGQDTDGEVMPGLVPAVTDAEDYVIPGGVAVVVVVADRARFEVTDCEGQALSTCRAEERSDPR